MKRKIFPSAIMRAAVAGALLIFIAAPAAAAVSDVRTAAAGSWWDAGSWLRLWDDLMLVAHGSGRVAAPAGRTAAWMKSGSTDSEPDASITDDTRPTVNPDGTPINVP
jgi:hypothetical protein